MTQEHITIKLKVITVDDSPLIADRLRLLLNDLDNVEWLGNAPSIPAALDCIEEKRPHVVILDINLSRDEPGNGIDLLNLLKKAYPLVKIIMLTNISNYRYRDICKSLGADEFLDKSNDFEKIPEKLHSFYNKDWMEQADYWWQDNI